MKLWYKNFYLLQGKNKTHDNSQHTKETFSPDNICLFFTVHLKRMLSIFKHFQVFFV